MERLGRTAEGRQRWRIVFRRTTLPEGVDQVDAWSEALAASGLPLVGRDADPPRIRPSLAAPLPAGSFAERELLDIVLTETLSVAEVRTALVGALPFGCTLVELHDVWLGEPALPGQVVAADYRIEVATEAGPPEPEVLARAAAALLAADALPRTRERGGGPLRYDLRPLLADVRLADPGPPPVVACRVRFDPARGVGRPSEVVAALGDAAGLSGLRALSVVRERFHLVTEADAVADAVHTVRTLD